MVDLDVHAPAFRLNRQGLLVRIVRIAALPQAGQSKIAVHWYIEDAEGSAAAWQGICNVSIPIGQPSGKAIAELHALHHLLTVCRVFGPQTVPHNCSISVSSPGVIALLTETSVNLRLIPFGRFLYFVMDEAALVVDDDTKWVSELPVKPEKVFPVAFAESLCRRINISAIGDVRLTRHASVRFAQRYCVPRNEPCAPWYMPKKIMKLLNHSTIQKVELSPQSKLNKILNHFKEASIYARPDLDVAFVIASDNDGLYMASVITWNPGLIK